jgi:hypothetical protein
MGYQNYGYPTKPLDYSNPGQTSAPMAGANPTNTANVKDESNPWMTNVSQGTTGTGAKPASGSNPWVNLATDPNLWASIFGVASDIANKPKDGKFVETPMPPEVRALMAQYLQYAGNSPTRNLISPMAAQMMQATGIPQFQMTDLIHGKGIPGTANGQPWTYRSGGTPQKFDFNAFKDQFANYLSGKAQGGNAGPRDLSDLKGPNGNPIGSKGRVMAGGKNKDLNGVDPGGWSSDYYRGGGGGMNPFDQGDFWGGGGPRDEFGMVQEGWRQTALENPEFSAAYGRYSEWMNKMPPEQRAAEEKKQAELEAKVKQYGKAAIKGVLMDPTFYGSMITGTTGIWALNKLKNLAVGVAKNEAGQWALTKTNNNPAVKALIMLANNMGTITQIAGAL